jgi:hypothetical protein
VVGAPPSFEFGSDPAGRFRGFFSGAWNQKEEEHDYAKQEDDTLDGGTVLN